MVTEVHLDSRCLLLFTVDEWWTKTGGWTELRLLSFLCCCCFAVVVDAIDPSLLSLYTPSNGGNKQPSFGVPQKEKKEKTPPSMQAISDERKDGEREIDGEVGNDVKVFDEYRTSQW